MKQSTENRDVFSFLKIKRILITLSLILTTLQLPLSAQVYGQQTKAASAGVVAGIDTTFAPRVEHYGYVNRAVPLPDGKTVIFGIFDKIKNAERKNVVRLNADDTLDTSFNVPENLSENFSGNALEFLPDGKFITVNNGTIVRYNSDGSIDYSFNFARTVRIINTLKFKARSDGKVFVYGQFTVKKRNLEIARNLIVLDEIGGIESGYTVGDFGQINDVTFLPDGKTAVTGNFEVKRNGAAVGKNFAVLDQHGLIDANFDTFFNEEINLLPVKKVIVQADGKLLVYGNYKGAYKQNGLRRIISKNKGITRLNADGSFDQDFSVPFASAHVAQTIVQPDGRILLFGALQGSNANFKFLTRLYPDGSLDNSFNENMPLSSAYAWWGTSEMQLLPDGKLLVSGHFRVNNQPNVEKLVRLNSDGTHDNSFQTGLIVGGDPTGFYSLPDGKVFIYGNFGKIGTRTRIGLARLNADGSTDETFRCDAVRLEDVDVKAITLQSDGKILIGGRFAVVNGEYIYNAAQALSPSSPSLSPVVRLNPDGSLDNSFAPYTNVYEEITSIVLQPDGKILLAGISTNTFYTFVVRLNPDGTVDVGFNRPRFFQSSATPAILAVALQPDGKILVGGYFQQIENLTQYKIARLNADGSFDVRFTYDGYFHHTDNVGKILVQPDGKILVGGESLGNTTRAPGLARFNPDATLDSGFRWNSGSLLTNTLDLQLQPDGKILFAGYMGYGVLADVLPHDLYRMNQNGGVEMRYNLPVDKFVSQADGKIVVQVYHQPTQSMSLKRVFYEGGVDDTFNFALGGGKARGLLRQPDGKILLAGKFKTINGVSQPGVARLNP